MLPALVPVWSDGRLTSRVLENYITAAVGLFSCCSASAGLISFATYAWYVLSSWKITKLDTRLLRFWVHLRLYLYPNGYYNNIMYVAHVSSWLFDYKDQAPLNMLDFKCFPILDMSYCRGHRGHRWDRLERERTLITFLCLSFPSPRR